MKKTSSYFNFLVKFFTPAIKIKSLALKSLVPVIFSSIASITTVYLIKEITNKLSNGIAGIYNLLLFLIIIVILNYLVVYFTRTWTHAVLWPALRKYMYSIYIQKYIQMDNNYIEKQGTGKLIATIDKGIHAWTDLIVRTFEELLPGFIMIISSFILITFINIYYSILLLVVFSFTLRITIYLQSIARKLRIERRENNIEMGKKSVKILMSKFEILQNDKGPEEINNISSFLNRGMKINFKVRNLGIWSELLIKIINDGSKILLILIFGFGLFGNILNYGEFIALISIAYIFDQILNKFMKLNVDYTSVFIDVEKLWSFFDNAPMMKGFDTGSQFIYKNGDISIQNLTFKYFKKNIFDNFSLEIKGGNKLAVVGPSGGGKTTLVKLISGYIHKNSGEIIIDGQNLSQISLKSYYKHIGYLTQEPSIFDGTIYENLTYSIDGELEYDELERILKLAKCDFVYTYEKGLQTEIGERGIRLSGGQKQRLAIAKIMLKNPKIIFLDEPTSAMDSFNEDEVSEALYNLFKGKTVIIIAHRLQTVKHADRIIYIENGKIIEDGTHGELVKLGGKYKKMLDLQSGF